MKKFLSVLLALLILLSLSTLCVYATEDDEIEYGNFLYKVVDGDKIEITRHYYSDTDVVIPNQIDGKDVISIGDGAFYKDSYIKSVTLPDKLEYIGETAFGYCIDLNAIDVPATCNEIGQMAFFHCTHLEDIYIRNKDCIMGDMCIGYQNNGGYISKCSGYPIHGYKGGSVEEFAINEEREFIDLDESYLLGDADRDKTITVIDATTIQQFLAKIIDSSKIDLLAADTDKDNTISIIDATRIQQFLAKIIEQL